MPNLLSAKLLSYLRNNQFLSLTGNLVVSGMNVISVSLLFRGLQVSEIGVWVFFLSTLGLVDAIRTGFITTAFIRSYAGTTPTRAAEVMGSTWVIALIITGALSFLSVIAYLVPQFHQDPGMDLFLQWFGVIFWFTLPSFIATCVLQAEFKFDKILYIRLLTQGLFVIAIIVLMFTRQLTLERVVYSNIITAAVTSLLALRMGWTKFNLIRFNTKNTLQELSHFGKYSIGSYVGSSLLRSSDTFIINFMLGPAALAIYNLAQRFMELVEIPLRSTLAIAMPSLSAAANQQNEAEISRIVKKNAGMLTWLLIPFVIGTIIFADVPIYLVGGSKYVDTPAANLLRVSMAMVLLYPIERFFGVTMDIINKPEWNLYKVFFMLAINVGGDFLGIFLFGNLYGIAFSTPPTIIGGFLFGYYLLNKKIPISAKEILNQGYIESKSLVIRFLSRKKSINVVSKR